MAGIFCDASIAARASISRIANPIRKKSSYAPPGMRINEAGSSAISPHESGLRRVSAESAERLAESRLLKFKHWLATPICRLKPEPFQHQGDSIANRRTG
jgi:hypothetical protein